MAFMNESKVESNQHDGISLRNVMSKYEDNSLTHNNILEIKQMLDILPLNVKVNEPN